jgi:replication-associated recombination protein RarA
MHINVRAWRLCAINLPFETTFVTLIMKNNVPLAERIRPQSLDELLGQQHLVGKGSILRTAIENGKVPSMIFWGPPGNG